MPVIDKEVMHFVSPSFELATDEEKESTIEDEAGFSYVLDKEQSNVSIPEKSSTIVQSVSKSESDESTVEQVKKLSERLKAYGASKWMCRRVTLGRDATLVPGVGGVAIIPELDLNSRQRTRLKVSKKRLLGTPPSSLFQLDTSVDESTQKETVVKLPQVKINAKEIKTNEESKIEMLLSMLDREENKSSESSDHSTTATDVEEELGFETYDLEDLKDTCHQTHTLETSAPWYSQHRRPQKIRDEVKADISNMLEKNAIWRNRTLPPRTISRERVEELARPRRHDDIENKQKHLIIRGKVDNVCQSRRRHNHPQKRAFQLQKRPEDAKVAQWRIEKERMNNALAAAKQSREDEKIKRSKMLHHYLSMNASQNLALYIESRIQLLKKAKEKKDKTNETFNALKGGGSVWDLSSTIQDGIRVIR